MEQNPQSSWKVARLFLKCQDKEMEEFGLPYRIHWRRKWDHFKILSMYSGLDAEWWIYFEVFPP